MKKHVRFLSLLLSIVMLFSLLSVSAFAAETPEEEAEVTSAAPEEEAETPAAAPEETEAETPAADPEEPEAETPAPAPEEEAEDPAAPEVDEDSAEVEPEAEVMPLADEEEEEPQTAPALTIEGYTRVTELPENGLATGKYLIVVSYDGKYYMVYPGATGTSKTAKNSARLVVDSDGKATGYQVGCGTTYDDAEVSTDFSAADNAIFLTGNTRTVGDVESDTYHIIADGPASAQYLLGYSGVEYGTSGDDFTAPVILPSATSGHFYIRAGNSGNSYVFFFSTNMNFNHAGALNNATYFGDLMLFKSSAAYTPDPKPVQAAPVIPGYTQLTNLADLDETKGYMIVSQDAKGNLYALYPSAEGETLGAGSLPAPDSEDDGARTAKLTVSEGTVSAVWLKDDSALTSMDEVLFSINGYDDGYLFTAFNDRHLNMANTMFTEGSVALTLANRGVFAGNSFQIKNIAAGRNLDFTKTGDPNAFFSGSGQSINYWGTDFWCPRGDYRMPVYLFASDTTKAPTAKERLQNLIERLSEVEDTGYINASWNLFQTALSDANAKLNDTSVDDNARFFVDAWNDLQSAYKSLQRIPVVPEGDTRLNVSDMIPASGTTADEPFAFNTAGSNKFRIPAIITLQHQTDTSKNGRLVAAIDARWNHTGDACGLDTIASYSDDNGANWNYNFPNYFGDGTDTKQNNATAFIDPVIVEGNDGTIYLMVDLWPGGVALNTAPMRPDAATGYVKIDGKQRLVLYLSPVTSAQTDDNYVYYVGDFTDGYAPVMERTVGANGDTYSFSGFYVDKYYYLYNNSAASFADISAKGADADKIWCQRLGATGTWVQQNVFFYNANLHARNASYLWIVTSKDGGETWSEPQMINDQVRTGEDQFYGVGPGAGLCIEDGTILLPVYIWSDEHAGFIYSRDNGMTWKRSEHYATVEAASSSESCLIQIDEKTVRHFYRESWNRDLVPVAYTDHTWNGRAWETGPIVRVNDAVHYGACQVSAIKYSEQIDGKDVILYSAPAGGNRIGGVIHVFLVNNDKNHTMALYNSYNVNEINVQYAYSSLTETKDGKIALLYESTSDAVIFKVIPITDIIAPVGVIGYEGTYDGKAHSVSVITFGDAEPQGIQYSTDDGETWVDENPAFTKVGTYTVKVKWTLDGNTEEASATVVINEVPASPNPGGSSGGGSNSKPSSSTTKPNSSITTTVIDQATGTVTETTKKEDGSVKIVETKTDGTVTATAIDADGSKAEKVTTPDKDVTITATSANGEVLAKVEIPAEIPAPETRFDDVPEGHWADKAIHNMAALEIINGVGGNTFNRDGGMKRGDLTLLLARMSNSSVSGGTAFTDVPDSAYYAEGVAWATKTGVVTGRGESVFAPDDTITREELAVMLHRYAKLLKLDDQAAAGSLDGFTDGGNTHSWAKDGMAWCVSKGILQGKGNGVLDPGTNVTRAEVAVMLQRFMDLMK